MFPRALFLFTAVAFTDAAAFCFAQSGSAPAADDHATLDQSFQNVVLPHLKTYCLDCHGSDQPEAMLDLSGYESATDVGKAHQTWAVVLERIEAAEMPPKDSQPQPTSQESAAIAAWIKTARQLEAQRNAGEPGIVLARRLSNAEYNYTIRDLTKVDIRPTDTFPVDSANEAGFDNTGESLTMSPALLKKYLDAARQVAEHLVLLPNGIAFAPHPVVTDTDRDKYCVNRIVDFYQRQPVNYADYFYAAWKYQQSLMDTSAAVTIADIAAKENVSPRYLQTVHELLTDSEETFGPVATLQRMWNQLPASQQINGQGEVENANAAVRSQCVAMSEYVTQLRSALVPPVEKVGVKEIHTGSQTFVLWRNRQYAANRRTLNTEALIVSDPDNTNVGKDLLISADPERQKLEQAAFARFCDVFPDQFFISERGRDYVNESSKQQGEKGRLLSAGFHSMMGYFRDDQPLYDLVLNEQQQQELDALWQQLDFVASAPMRQYVGFLWFERTDSRYMRDPQFDFARAEDKHAQSADMIHKLADEYIKKARENGGEGLAIEAIQQFFDGINEQIRWVEKARLEAEPSHIQAVIQFAEKAFRRPLTAIEVSELADFYKLLRNDEHLNHEEAIQDMVVSVLMSPHFCYRVDMAANTSESRPLTDFELANRLSYFLWSSMPDERLLQAAKRGTLHQPEVFLAETRRMLQDDRIRGLAVEFGGNWLDIRRFEEHNSVDRQRFPEFNDDLRQAMFEEPIQFFIDLVQHDRSVLNFLNGDYTFVNLTLAKHYGIATTAADFQESTAWTRIDRAEQFGRGGLLPMSVFLTKNAPGLRTSPVKRGYWVVRRLLGERIPPPPPNVPELPDDESKLGELTLRQALAKHREHKSCSGCHERIDSIGLVFEGYGPVGELRTVDLGDRPVDTTATLPNGRQASGLDELRRYINDDRQEEFVDNFCRKLLSYGLGRGLILPDEILLQEIQANLKANDHHFATLIETIVTSPQFLTKRGSGEQ